MAWLLTCMHKCSSLTSSGWLVGSFELWFKPWSSLVSFNGTFRAATAKPNNGYNENLWGREGERMCVHVRSCMGRWKRNEVIKWCVHCCVQSREEKSACMCFLLCRFLPPIANHIDKVQSPAFLMAEFQEDNAHTFYFFSFPPLPLLFSIHPLHNGTVPASSTSANADELSAAINKAKHGIHK